MKIMDAAAFSQITASAVRSKGVIQISAGGPGSGRKPTGMLKIKHTGLDFKTAHSALTGLGYSLKSQVHHDSPPITLKNFKEGYRGGNDSDISRYSHPSGAKAQFTDYGTGTRLTMNAPLDHHNAVRTAAGRSEFTPEQAADRDAAAHKWDKKPSI
jgi:hypothetical protein